MERIAPLQLPVRLDAEMCARGEQASGKKYSLSWHHQRHQYVRRLLEGEPGESRIIDLGCHDGEFLESLARWGKFAEVVGVDKCPQILRQAQERLAGMPHDRRAKARVLETSLLSRDVRLCGFDVGVCLEVVEHINPEDLPVFAEVIFGFADLPRIILTTPNQEYNCLFGLKPHQMRIPDHRFEWTRRQFQTWARGVAALYGYQLQYFAVGDNHPEYGEPTQAAIFTRR